jgi:hypothetical protein
MLLRGPVRIGPANLDVHSLLTMAFMAVLGIQAIFTGLFANLYAHIVGILPTTSPYMERLRRFSLEKLLVIALALGFAGLTIFGVTFWDWYSAGFPDLDYRVTMRRIIPALTLVTISGQAFFNGFLLSLLFFKTSSPIGKGINEKLD